MEENKKKSSGDTPLGEGPVRRTVAAGREEEAKSAAIVIELVHYHGLTLAAT